MSATFVVGCGQPVDFTYGKASDRSANGLSVFANLLRERGHNVVRKRRLTNRLNRFDSIVWAPDNEGMPPEEVVAWLEEWLATTNKSKVLIYIGRSYDAEVPFYRCKSRSSDPSVREQWRRELAEVLLREREFGGGWWNTGGNEENAFWFEQQEPDQRFPRSIGGPWAKGVDVNAIELECRELLVPMQAYDDEDNFPTRIQDYVEEEDYYDYTYYGQDPVFREQELKVRELLTVDGKPFAFEVFAESGNGKIIVISNGSFLLNFPLMNAEHQKLATLVADEVNGDVVFLESDYVWPRVGGPANDPTLQWSWIGKAPMVYIVPHFLFWGVLYIFAFYPNFGRPKRLKFHPPKAFKNHVRAVAAILKRSKEKDWARRTIETWHKRNKSS